MVGIEIVYKKSPPSLIERKTQLLNGMGRKVYTINSENTYHTIEAFFRRRRKNKELEWENLEDDLPYLFAEKYHRQNDPCLLYYLRYKYFTKELINY